MIFSSFDHSNCKECLRDVNEVVYLDERLCDFSNEYFGKSAWVFIAFGNGVIDKRLTQKAKVLFAIYAY